MPLLPRRRTASRLMAVALAVALLLAGGGQSAAAQSVDATPVTGGAFFERADADGVGLRDQKLRQRPKLL